MRASIVGIFSRSNEFMSTRRSQSRWLPPTHPHHGVSLKCPTKRPASPLLL
ncbi:hypothetical protein B0O80DRAFT_459600, partial [Mortierella sp. GBAus27b]